MGISMCSEKDCRIFRGMIQACNECRAYVALDRDEPAQNDSAREGQGFAE